MASNKSQKSNVAYLTESFIFNKWIQLKNISTFKEVSYDVLHVEGDHWTVAIAVKSIHLNWCNGH